MQYLTLRETVRRLRAAGVSAKQETVREWIREQRLRDVWVVGGHLYVYEAELDALIRGLSQECGAPAGTRQRRGRGGGAPTLP